MPTYNCTECTYTTTHKNNLRTHFKRGIPCNPNLTAADYVAFIADLNKPKFHCEYCDYSAQTRQLLKDHATDCAPTCEHQKQRREKDIQRHRKLQLEQRQEQRDQQLQLTKEHQNTLETFNPKVFASIIPSTIPESEYLEYIYILIEREFIKLKQQVFKVGYTKNFRERIQDYPKGTKLLGVYLVGFNARKAEADIIRALNEQYDNRSDIGAEYFEGDFIGIRKVVSEICDQYADSIFDFTQLLPKIKM